jgi:hypothetical protein
MNIFTCTSEAAKLENRMSGPYTVRNLSVYLIHGEDKVDMENLLTFDEAIESGHVKVHETGNVGELEIENMANRPVFIQSGCIVKGGRQDRMIRYDLVIKPKSGKQPLASFCVESGRWSARGEEDEQQFVGTEKAVPHKEIKLAARLSGSQSEVWESIEDVEQTLSRAIRGGRAANAISPSSLPLMLDNSEIQDSLALYIDFLEEQFEGNDDILGMAVAINGKPSSADIYRSSWLFRKYLPMLLEAAATEALSERKDNDGEFAPTLNAIMGWLDDVESGSADTEEIASGVFQTSMETDKAAVFETRYNSPDSIWIHRNVIGK